MPVVLGNKQWHKIKKFKAKREFAVFAKVAENVRSVREKEFGMNGMTTGKDVALAEASAGVPNAREAANLKPNRFEHDFKNRKFVLSDL